MRRIRVGLLGFGWVNRTVWLPRIRHHPSLVLAAVFDPTWSGASSYRCSTLPELFERDLDLVIVGTPNHTHAALAHAALERDVPVVVEKPVCLSLAEFDWLADRALHGDAGLLVSRSVLRRTDVRALTDRMLDGPVSIRASWLRTNGIPCPGSWFTRKNESGGGALLDLGWHLADVALGLLGYPYPSSVTVEWADQRWPAWGDAVAARWRGDVPGPDPRSRAGISGGDVELDATLWASFACGSQLALRAAWISDTDVDTTRFLIEGGSDRMELTTTFGFSPHRVAEPSLTAVRAGCVDRLAVPAEVGREYDAQLEAMVAFAHGRLDWRTELGQSRAVLTLLDSAYRAGGRPLVELRGDELAG